MTKDIPARLRLKAKARSNDAADKITQAMDKIIEELRSGKLGRHTASIDQAYVLRLAGLNRDFLKGHAHRDTTRPKVVAFISEVNEALRSESEDPEDVIVRLRDEIKETDRRYKAVCDRINDWAIRVRSLQRENHNLRVQIAQLAAHPEVKILPIKR